MKKSKSTKQLTAANVGIITALPKEYAAVCEVLGCKAEIDVPGKGAGRKYAIGNIKTKAGAEHVVAVALLPGMGNNSAAIRATQMTQHCPNLDHIVMVGIAGAVPNPHKPDSHVRLGDIVVSDQKGVIQYDFDKEESKITEPRHSPRPPSASLIEAVSSLSAKQEQNKRPWETRIKAGIAQLGPKWKRPSSATDVLQDEPKPTKAFPHPRDVERRKGQPKVFHGPIASANKLLKNPTKRDALRDKFAVKAVEMEGSGVADAAWNLDKGYLVVRGTCDYCNPAKGDGWHRYAALAAAAYARCVIEAISPQSGENGNDQKNNGGDVRGVKPQKIGIKIANTNTTIEILFGDLFALDGLRAIAVSEFFDSKLGNPVSPNSLHGIFLNRCFSGKPEKFDDQVTTQLRGIPAKTVKKSEGKRKSYPIGTSVLVTDGKARYAVFALCKADPTTCKADANMAMLFEALDGLWKFARIKSDGEPVNLPLVGGGLSRIGLPPRDLLNLIIISAIKETKVKEIAKTIRIVLHSSLFAEVDLRDVETHWKQ